MVLDEDGENGFARPFGLWLPLDRSAVSLTAGYPVKAFMREDTSVCIARWPAEGADALLLIDTVIRL